MKASLKFRDDQKPLLRAKLPINILNFPFQSGIVAGSSKELSLHLTTFFGSGPSIKLVYKPNDAFDPFALVVKTGTGKYGSPLDSCMVMSAQFKLCAGGNGNPSFFVHFKPRFGDFQITKKQGSVFAENGCKLVNGSVPVIDENFEVLGVKRMDFLQEKLLKGVEIGAMTSLPVLNLANVKLGWGLRFPTEAKDMVGVKDGLVINRPLPAVSFRSFPFLAMNKISIEQVRGGKGEDISPADSVRKPRADGDGDVSMMCLGMRHQLEALREENGMLRKAVEDLRLEISGGKLAGEIKHREDGRAAGYKAKDVKEEDRSLNHVKEEGKKH